MSESSSSTSRKPSLILEAMTGSMSELKKQKAIWDSFGVMEFYEKQKKEQEELMNQLKKARAKKAVQKRVLKRIRERAK